MLSERLRRPPVLRRTGTVAAETHASHDWIVCRRVQRLRRRIPRTRPERWLLCKLRPKRRRDLRRKRPGYRHMSGAPPNNLLKERVIAFGFMFHQWALSRAWVVPAQARAPPGPRPGARRLPPTTPSDCAPKRRPAAGRYAPLSCGSACRQRCRGETRRRCRGKAGWPKQDMAGVFFRTALLDYVLYRQYFPLHALGLYERRRRDRLNLAAPAACAGASAALLPEAASARSLS